MNQDQAARAITAAQQGRDACQQLKAFTEQILAQFQPPDAKTEELIGLVLDAAADRGGVVPAEVSLASLGILRGQATAIRTMCEVCVHLTRLCGQAAEMSAERFESVLCHLETDHTQN